MFRKLAIAVVMLVLAANAPARADAKVTQCTRDGIAAALGTGGLVTFECPGDGTIQMGQAIPITANAVIDGGLKITLLQGDGPMFVSQLPGATLELKNLRFRDTKQEILRSSGGPGVVLTVSGSTFTNCDAPFRVQGLPMVVRETVFTDCTGVVVTVFDQLTIERSRFEGTKGHAVFSFGPDVTTRIVDTEFIGGADGPLMIGTSSSGNASHKVEIVRSTFSKNGGPANDAQRLQGTGAISLGCSTEATQCTLTISSSRFLNNTATSGGGGAIRVSGATSFVVKGSRFEGNSSDDQGGAILYDAGQARDAVLNLQNTVFRSNKAKQGGAVRVLTADVKGQSVTFSRNEASESGGGLHATDGAVTISGGVFVDNTATQTASAISLFGGKPSVLANTLIIRNKSPAGAFAGENTRFVNSTVMDNTGIGIQMPQGSAGKRIALRNSIVASNSTQNCALGAGGSGSGNPSPPTDIVDEGNNIEFPGNTCSPNAMVAQPGLDSLYLPILGSPAMGKGDNAVCLAAPVFARDVYSKRRPQGIACSIGAAEGDLTKEIADRTVGGLAWPPGKTTQRPKDGGIGGTGPEGTRTAPDSAPCCCCGR